MHDHGEKIHTCKPCGYWHVAGGRFETWECPNCKAELITYSSRDWAIKEIDPIFEGIPKDKTRQFHAQGFLKQTCQCQHTEDIGFDASTGLCRDCGKPEIEKI